MVALKLWLYDYASMNDHTNNVIGRHAAYTTSFYKQFTSFDDHTKRNGWSMTQNVVDDHTDSMAGRTTET